MKDRMIKKQSMNTIAIISGTISMMCMFALIGLSFYAMLEPANATRLIEKGNDLIIGLFVLMVSGFMIATIKYG